jgi:outer membrane protein TolC
MHVQDFAGLLTLALFGCASVAPPRELSAQVAIPPAWSVGTKPVTDGNPILAEWWRRFVDPLLNARFPGVAIKQVPGNATASQHQARALRDVARAALFPVLNASAGVQRGSNGQLNTGNSFSAGLDASWELDISENLANQEDT